MTPRSLISALLICFLTIAQAAAEPLKILFIGNSYTGGIKNAVTQLIKQSPHADTELVFINPGGKTLEFHLANQATLKRIKTGNFDFVVLQDQSQFPAVHPERFDKAARQLDKLIDASGAKTVFYQTWGRRDGDAMNLQKFPDYASMQQALSKSYRSTAKNCSALLAPVGDTWASIRKSNPKLGRELYRKDGSHPSAKGAYLAACVFYQTLFKQPASQSKFKGKLTPEEQKLILKATTSTR